MNLSSRILTRTAFGSFLVLMALVRFPIWSQASDAAVPGIQEFHWKRSQPRPLQIHGVHIHLRERSLEPVVVMAPDPDGDGPAETTLRSPLELAGSMPLQIAVNANAWNMTVTNGGLYRPPYVAGAFCDPLGWVVVAGAQRSAPDGKYWSLWGDRPGHARIGNPARGVGHPLWAVAGFGGLLRKGQVLPAASEVRHPRTAAGLDRPGHRLTLVVVDGRQSGYSEGMSERELAELMLELDCSDALNLDGGGSSILLQRNNSGGFSIINRPSDVTGPRPIPVLFGIARRP